MSSAPVRVLQVAFILGAAATAYSFVASGQDGELRKSCMSLCGLGPNYAGEDRIAPNVTLPDLHGKARSLSDLRGKTVLLVFWNTSCDSCKKQMKSLAARARMLRGDPNSALLTVAVDESVEEVHRVLKATTGQPEPFPVLLDSESKFVLGQYGTKKFPETWVIDPNGVIRARFDGPRDWSSSMVSDLLRNVRRGTDCPLEVKERRFSGPGARICQETVL